jgi:hypothetical protein
MERTMMAPSEQEFLHEQRAQAAHKVARYESAAQGCHDCLEREGLAALLKNAHLEQALLNDLAARQSSSEALSLDAVIMEQLNHHQDEAAQHLRRWQPGHPTPEGYWEAETRQTFLADLLRRYHAWRTGRPYYRDLLGSAARANGAARPAASAQGVHPWYPLPLPANGDDELAEEGAALEALRHTIYEALRSQQFPEAHVELVVQPRGAVMVKGYAHSADERAAMIRTMERIPGVRELLIDLEVVAPGRCPICARSGS